MLFSVIAMIVSIALTVVCTIILEIIWDLAVDLIKLIRGDKEDVVTEEECKAPFYGSDEMESAYKIALNTNRGGSQNDSIKK